MIMLNLNESTINEICKNDFVTFRKVKLGRKIADMHAEMADIIVNDKRHFRVMASRQHGKSTTLIDLVLWLIYRSDKPIRIAIISHNMERSNKMLMEIKKIIDDNLFLSKELKPKSRTMDTVWRGTMIVTNNGHSVECVPCSGAARGTTADYIILDDIMQGEDIEIDKIKEIFWGVIYPIVSATKGKIILSGTPISFYDLLYDVSDKDAFICRDYPAVITDENGRWIKPQFPELYTLDELRKIKETVPPHLWAREYMLQPVSPGTQFFPEDRIQQSLKRKPISNSWTYHFGIDVAMSESERSDYTVITVLGENTDNQIKFFEKVRRRGLNEDGLFTILQSLDNRYNFYQGCVEQVGLSYGLVRSLQEEDRIMIDGKSVQNKFIGRTLSYKTGRSGTESRDKLIGQILQSMIDEQLILSNDDILLQELRSFSVVVKKGREVVESVSKHDDCVFSLGLAIQSVFDSRGGQFHVDYV
ncbi:MAG: hypothetical protein ACTSXD_06845 [Candidatus Heimdallarchaeaceae archaeon]